MANGIMPVGIFRAAFAKAFTRNKQWLKMMPYSVCSVSAKNKFFSALIA
jgi:hypothetical protein